MAYMNTHACSDHVYLEILPQADIKPYIPSYGLPDGSVLYINGATIHLESILTPLLRTICAVPWYEA